MHILQNCFLRLTMCCLPITYRFFFFYFCLFPPKLLGIRHCVNNRNTVTVCNFILFFMLKDSLVVDMHSYIRRVIDTRAIPFH